VPEQTEAPAPAPHPGQGWPDEDEQHWRPAQTEALEALLDRMWADPALSPRLNLVDRCAPLSEMTTDRTRPGTAHPYWDLLLRAPAPIEVWERKRAVQVPLVVPDRDLLEQSHRLGLWPDHLRRWFTWCIPTPSDLELTADAARRAGGLVEVFAGTGYWAWQLSQHLAGDGLPVDAYDQAPPGSGLPNRFVSHPEGWFRVQQAGPEAAGLHPDRALLMCYPPQDDPAAYEALDAYRGGTLILAADHGFCGDESFWGRVADEWQPAGVSQGHVSFRGYEGDLVTVWTRRGAV